MAAARHAHLAEELGLRPSLINRLALDAYYVWLLDSSERGDRAIESCGAVRQCLGVELAAATELYAFTGIDELVLTARCEQMLNDGRPLSASAQQELAHLDGLMGARPGVANTIVFAAGG